ncbi:MAG: hypothetical protein ACR2QO_26830 [Acidimicrobiales bacterium]
MKLIDPPLNIQTIDDLEQGFVVTHSVVEHDLLSPDGIVALADRLPGESAEPGLVGLVAEGGLDYEATPMLDAGPAVRQLDGEAASLYLYNVERDPLFGSLLREILTGLTERFGMGAGHIVDHEGYVFLTGGPATTSAHVDHEYNFLLVIRGRKRVFIADVPSVEGERALEALHSGGYGACDAVPDSGTVFEIGPGEGVFIPPRAAHYVENGVEPCAALSVVFATESLRREARIYRVNALLRRLGLKPSPPGTNAMVDAAKSLFAQGVAPIRRGLRRVLRRTSKRARSLLGRHR